MNCYICDKQPHPGGTLYHVGTAVGICHNCGVAVCAEHSSRASAPGSPLLCPSCARLLSVQNGMEAVVQETVAH